VVKQTVLEHFEVTEHFLHPLHAFDVVLLVERELDAAIALGVTRFVDVVLDRPAILTPLVQPATALVGTYGSGDGALFDSLTGAITPKGRLPFDIPRSMEAVRRHGEDIPGFDDPLFRFGDGLDT
jgi:hypothetical protein